MDELKSLIDHITYVEDLLILVDGNSRLELEQLSAYAS